MIDIDNKRASSNQAQSKKISHADKKHSLTDDKYRDTIDLSPKPITNGTINSVGAIAFNGLDIKQSLKIKQMCQSVLREAKQYSAGVECSETYSLSTFNGLS